MDQSSVVAVAQADGVAAVRCSSNAATVVIYVTQHCPTCVYTHEVAAFIRTNFPHVAVRLVDLENPGEAVPESVFATPTYLLNGHLWSLGNPSTASIVATLGCMAGTEHGASGAKLAKGELAKGEQIGCAPVDDKQGIVR